MKSFDKIIGYESVKNELYQIIDMFKNKDAYLDMGARIPNGVLIYGNPGLGKTMLANAMIEEIHVKAYILRNNKNERDLIREINTVFIEASHKEKCIIFFDDLDKFSEATEDDIDDRVFVTIQANIDIVKDKNVLIIATVNNMDKLPHSLKRNGRFDRKIGLVRPTREDSAKIIEFYLKQKKVNPDINYQDIVKMINYTSCADLETIINESAILAAYARKESVDIEDIVQAYSRYAYETPLDQYECSSEAIEATSIHEAGHAVMAEVIKKGSIGLLSIQSIERDVMSGFTYLCEDIERTQESILIALGGKAASELLYSGKCARGCEDDLRKAMMMIEHEASAKATYGLSLLKTDDYTASENMKTKCEVLIQTEMERYLFIAKEVILKNKEFVYRLAETLKSKRTLLYSDIQRIRDRIHITEFKL